MKLALGIAKNFYLTPFVLAIIFSVANPSNSSAFVFDFKNGIGNDFFFYSPSELFSYDDTNGIIRITKPEDTITADDVKYGKLFSNFLVGGDFEISVDYILNSPLNDGDQLEFQIYNSDGVFFNVRSNEDWIGGDNYHVYSDNTIEPQPGIPTSDEDGSLKIIRTGDQVTAFFRSAMATQYTEIYSKNLNTNAMRVVFSLQNQPQSHSALDATFDNLRIECERFIYPRSADSDNDGVINEWDTCPDTPENSVVYSNGCPHIKGDWSDNSLLGLEDCIGILQILTNLRQTDF